jgi:hypothetical protein
MLTDRPMILVIMNSKYGFIKAVTPYLYYYSSGIFLCLIFCGWVLRHEGVLGEWRYSSTHCLTSALDGGEWSASFPGRYIPRERAPGTHWIVGWVGSRANLDAVVTEKFPAPAETRTPTIQPVAKRYTIELSRLHTTVVISRFWNM